MKIEKEFVLLKIENKLRTNDDGIQKTYLILSALDENLVPCNFFVFRDEVVNSILQQSNGVKPFTKVLIDFDLSYNGKMWNCNLLDILFTY